MSEKPAESNSDETESGQPVIHNEPLRGGLPRDEMLAIQNRALYYTKNNQFRKAIEEYNTLLKNDKRFLTVIGMCQYRLHEYQNAVNTLREAEDLGNFPFQTKKFLSFSYYELNELSRSSDYAEEALKYGSDPELLRLVKKLARENSVMKNYRDLGMENFLIQFSREEHDSLRTIVSDYLKEAYREIGKVLEYYPNRQFVVILYNEKNFFDVTRAPGWAGGMYDGKIRIPVRGLSGADRILRKVIFHEYTHALISEITQKCPLWINEGLAEYFSEPDEDLNLVKPVPLNYLESRFPSGDPRLVSLAYRTSHAAVKYLVEKFGVYSIKELLENFREGKSLNNAFESVLYITYDDFLTSWNKQ